MVGSASVELSTSYQKEWSSGKTETESTTYVTQKEITIPACHKI
jgi:hypothetical protein